MLSSCGSLRLPFNVNDTNLKKINIHTNDVNKNIDVCNVSIILYTGFP